MRARESTSVDVTILTPSALALEPVLKPRPEPEPEAEPEPEPFRTKVVLDDDDADVRSVEAAVDAVAAAE